MIETTFRSSSFFVCWQTLNTMSLPNLNLCYPLSISTNVVLVDKKGHPKMTGTLKSTSQSRIIMYMMNVNFSTLRRTSYSIPKVFYTVWSSINNRMLIGVGDHNPSFLKNTRGIKFMLALRSHNALVHSTSPIVLGMVKAWGCSRLYTKELIATALQCWSFWESS